MTIPRVMVTGIEPGVSPPKPSGITPRFVSHSNKVTQMDSLWEWAVLRRGCVHGVLSIQGGGLNPQPRALSEQGTRAD